MADRITRCRPLLGTFVEVTADSGPAIDAAFEAIERAHRLMSAHEPASDLSKVNRLAHRQAVEVDRWTAAVLERALFWSRQSQGLFDIVRAGKAAVERGRLPLHPGQPRPEAGHWTWLELQGPIVRLLKPGCVDLGGIAKGFAVDRAVAALKAAGASLGLVNAGGDIAGFGPQPWPVQVVQPETRRAIANVGLCNGAIATSSVLPGGLGDHLVGRDGRLLSATACARNAMDADALAKIALSGSPIAAHCLRIAKAEAFVLASDGAICAIDRELRAA